MKKQTQYLELDIGQDTNLLLIRKFFYLILFALYLTPSFRISGLPAIRLEEILLALLGCILASRILKGKPVRIIWSSRQTFLVGFLFFITISIVNGTIQGYNSSVLEFTEFIKILKYLFIYTIAITVFNLSNNREEEIQNVINFMLKLSLFLFVMVVQQYFNFLNLNAQYIPMIAPTHYETLVGGYPYPRPVGMIGSPNELGFLLAITTLLAVFQILTKKMSIRYIITFAVSGIGMFMTLSRTSLVAFITGLVIFTLIYFNLRTISNISLKRMVRLFILSIFTFIVAAIILNKTDFTEEILWRFETLNDLSNNTSWQARLIHWQENINLFKENPILGVGTLSRANIKFAADNEWLLLLRSYGIVGMLYFILMFLIPYLRSKSGDLKVLALAILAACSVYMIPAAVFNSLALMPTVLIILSMSDKSGKALELTR